MVELVVIGVLYVASLLAFRVLGGFRAASDAVKGWGSGQAR
jgi:hypothetical protein